MTRLATAIFTLAILTSQARAAELEEVRIFTVFSYMAGHWCSGITAGIETGLYARGKKPVLEPFFGNKFLTWKDTPTTERKEYLIRLRNRIKAFKPDFIIVSDDEAAEIATPAISDLNIPIVFTAVNEQLEDASWLEPLKRSRVNISGVFERYPLQDSLKLLSDLTNNQTRKISLITSETPTSDLIVKEIEKFFKTNSGPIKLDKVYRSKHWEDWQTYVQDANHRGAALWFLVPWNVNKRGETSPIHLSEMGEWFEKKLKVPSISIVDIGLHLGAMASITVTPNMMGEEAAKIIVESLDKKIAIRDIPYRYPDRADITINEAAVKRMKISVPLEILEYARIIKKPHLPTRQ